MSRMPIAAGSPMCTGAPCTAGNRDVDLHRPDHPAGRNRPHRHHHRAVERPAGAVGTEVMYIGTFEHCSMCRTGMPASMQRRLEREAAADQERDEVVASTASAGPAVRPRARRAGRPGTSAGRSGGRRRARSAAARPSRPPRPRAAGTASDSAGRTGGSRTPAPAGRITRFAWTNPGRGRPWAGRVRPLGNGAELRWVRPTGRAAQVRQSDVLPRSRTRHCAPTLRHPDGEG